MPRQSAENQRRYRQRKRQEKEWLDTESSRVKSYYKPSSILTIRELEKRREKGRLAMAKTRHRRKIEGATVSSVEKWNVVQEKVLRVESNNPNRTTHPTLAFYCCKYCSCCFYNFSIFRNHVRSHEIIYRKFWITRGNGLTCKCGYVVQGGILRTHSGCYNWNIARRIRKSRHFAYSHVQPTKLTTLCRHLAMKSEPPREAHALIKYDAVKHSLPEHECSYCGYAFRKLSNLQLHIRVHTGDTNYKCKECDRHFVSKTGLAYHELSKHTKVKPFKCDLCGHGFIKFQHMERHKRTHLVEKPFKCKVCEKSYITNSNLKVHERTHTGVKQFHCKYCGQGFWQKGHMKDHMLMHGQIPQMRSGKANHCDICDKTFLRENNLIDHYRTHTGERPFICTYCGQGFTRNGLMLKHMRTHNRQERYKCDQCDLSFTAPANLRRHVMRNHSGVKPYICETCNKGFAFISDLRTHEQIHLPDCEKPHKCQICDRGYSVESKLKIHMQSHNGPAERLFECEYQDCNKSFATPSRRVRHHYTHTGTKKYKCPKCDRAFSQTGNLKRHVRNHDGLTPFKCIFCDIYRSAEKGNLKRHVKFKHPHDFTEANIAIMIDLANGNISGVENFSTTDSNSNTVVHVPVVSNASEGISQDDISLNTIVPVVSKASEGISQDYISSNSVVPVELKVSGCISEELPPLFEEVCVSLDSAIFDNETVQINGTE